MGVSGFSITPDRLSQVSFTIPHSTSSQVIMLNSTMDKYHITSVTSLEQLKALGITVGTQDGEIEQQQLQAAGVTMHSWGDSESAVQDMASANPSVQAVYAETPVTNAWMADMQHKESNRRYLQPPILSSCIRSSQRLTHTPRKDGRRTGKINR